MHSDPQNCSEQGYFGHLSEFQSPNLEYEDDKQIYSRPGASKFIPTKKLNHARFLVTINTAVVMYDDGLLMAIRPLYGKGDFSNEKSNKKKKKQAFQ